jgi:hypothetical protein
MTVRLLFLIALCLCFNARLIVSSLISFLAKHRKVSLIYFS